MEGLAALEGAAGLASSIITFVEFSIEFGKLVRSVTRAQGGLPRELDECREYIDVVAAWLEDIRRSIPFRTHTEEDRLLEQAIRRCQDTSEKLILLLATFCGGTTPDQKSSLVQRARAVLRDVTRAGKILWRKDEIVEIRDKLKFHRDDVHSHLGSRTGHHVKKVLDEQVRIGGAIRDLNEQFCHVVIRLENLEFQYNYIIMQNHQLTEKFDMLLGVMLPRNRDRLAQFAVVFDYVPLRPTISSAWQGIRTAAAFIFPRELSSHTCSLSEDVEGALIRQLTAQVSAFHQTVTVQVIVSSFGVPLSERPSLLRIDQRDLANNFTIARALQKVEGVSEWLPALKSTTRVVLLSIQPEIERQPLVDSIHPQSTTVLFDTNSRPIQQSLNEDAYRFRDNITAITPEVISNEIRYTGSTALPLVSSLVLHTEREWCLTTRVFIQVCVVAGICRLSSACGYFPDSGEGLFNILIIWCCHFTMLDSIKTARNNIAGDAPFMRTIALILKANKAPISLFAVAFIGLVVLLQITENYPELKHNKYILIPVFVLYFSALTVASLLLYRDSLMKFSKAALDFIMDREVWAAWIQGGNLTLGLLLSNCIVQAISKTSHSSQSLAPLIGAAFLMASVCHACLGFTDNSSRYCSAQMIYNLVMVAILSSILCLGNFVGYCITGPWIARCWIKRRTRERYAMMKQMV